MNKPGANFVTSFTPFPLKGVLRTN